MTKETQIYRAPSVVVIKVTAQSVLCLSENGSMYEKDLGDGGFTEE